MNAKKAFTLIELLVVIAIIAILAAILFPVFAQAKAAAKKTAALSNIKQLSTGVQIYLGDSDDTYPFGGGVAGPGQYGWNATYGGWAYDTVPYIKSIGIFRDASDPLTVPATPTWFPGTISSNGNQMITMVANGYTMYCPQTNSNQLMGLMGWATKDAGFQLDRNIVSATSFAHIADEIMLCERIGSDRAWGPDAFLEGHPYDDQYYNVAGDIPNGANDGTPYNKTGVNARLIDKDNRFGAVSHPYGNISVFAFADSHAKAMDPRATNPSTYGQQDKNLWNTFRP